MGEGAAVGHHHSYRARHHTEATSYAEQNSAISRDVNISLCETELNPLLNTQQQCHMRIGLAYTCWKCLW